MEIVNETRIQPNGTWRKRFVVLALLVTVIAVGLYYEIPGRVQQLARAALDWLNALGAWGPVVFVLLYIISCVAILPASVLTLGAGAVFGVVRGFIYVSLGATLGATAAFLIGRYFAREWVTRKIEGRPHFSAIEKAVSNEGWRIVFLTRLCPLFPFFLLNYAYGLTRISLLPYVWATWLGIMPGSLLFVYIGSLARSAHRGNSTIDWLKTSFILVTAILAAVYITRVARRALTRELDLPRCAETETD
jgi:uncharacterized membrane protein YdjX (TVP38/TMEM64 family)